MSPEQAQLYSLDVDTRSDVYSLGVVLYELVGGQQHDLKAGDFVHMPRGVEHYLKNISSKSTRMLLTYTPGGFEQWFLDVGIPVSVGSDAPPKTTSADIQAAVAAAQRYGVQFRKP